MSVDPQYAAIDRITRRYLAEGLKDFTVYSEDADDGYVHVTIKTSDGDVVARYWIDETGEVAEDEE